MCNNQEHPMTIVLELTGDAADQEKAINRVEDCGFHLVAVCPSKHLATVGFAYFAPAVQVEQQPGKSKKAR